MLDEIFSINVDCSCAYYRLISVDANKVLNKVDKAESC